MQAVDSHNLGPLKNGGLDNVELCLSVSSINAKY
jgi:hypothetical protein